MDDPVLRWYQVAEKAEGGWHVRRATLLEMIADWLICAGFRLWDLADWAAAGQWDQERDRYETKLARGIAALAGVAYHWGCRVWGYTIRRQSREA